MLKNVCFFGSCDFHLNFFAIFSKMRYIYPSGHLVFYEIFVAQTTITRFFSIDEMLHISAIYKSIMNLPMILSTSFVEKKI